MMEYKDQRELVEGLRAMADFIEEHPELPIGEPEIKLDTWLFDDSKWDVDHLRTDSRTAKEKLQAAARALGIAQKNYIGDYFCVTKKFGEFVSMEFTVSRETVCKRVVTGTRIVPAVSRPERTEEVVEWICDDPILAG